MLTSSYDNGNTSHTGAVLHLIKDGQKAAFQLTDARVRQYYAETSGNTIHPTNAVHYTDPTINGNAFAEMQATRPPNDPWLYQVQQCQTVMRPAGVKVLDRQERTLMIDVNSFTNSYSQTVMFNTGISREVTETTTSSWSQSHAFQASYTVTAGVNVLFLSGETSIQLLTRSNTLKQRRNQEEERWDLQLALKFQFYLEIHSAHVILFAAEGTGRVEVVYQAVPQRAVCFAQRYTGGSTSAFRLVTNVLSHHKLPTKINIPQIMNINNFGRTHTTTNSGLP